MGKTDDDCGSSVVGLLGVPSPGGNSLEGIPLELEISNSEFIEEDMPGVMLTPELIDGVSVGGISMGGFSMGGISAFTPLEGSSEQAERIEPIVHKKAPTEGRKIFLFTRKPFGK